MMMVDFAPLTRSSIGFDRLIDMVERATQGEQVDSYPPYNIEKTGEDSYRITLAVAGFLPEELDITSQPNQLVVAGTKTETASGEVLYQGIPGKAFRRQFSLADYVNVGSASLHGGLLSVELARQVPEAMKPRRIEIGGRAPQWIEGRQAA